MNAYLAPGLEPIFRQAIISDKIIQENLIRKPVPKTNEILRIPTHVRRKVWDAVNRKDYYKKYYALNREELKANNRERARKWYHKHKAVNNSNKKSK